MAKDKTQKVEKTSKKDKSDKKSNKEKKSSGEEKQGKPVNGTVSLLADNKAVNPALSSLFAAQVCSELSLNYTA